MMERRPRSGGLGIHAARQVQIHPNSLCFSRWWLRLSHFAFWLWQVGQSVQLADPPCVRSPARACQERSCFAVLGTVPRASGACGGMGGCCGCCSSMQRRYPAQTAFRGQCAGVAVQSVPQVLSGVKQEVSGTGVLAVSVQRETCRYQVLVTE